MHPSGLLGLTMPRGTCVSCGKSEHDDGSSVTWECLSCKGCVCRECTLTIPGSKPLEYYYETFCSKTCWEAAGSPEK